MSVSRDHELDLVTAAVVGIAAGVAVTLIVRNSRRRKHPLKTGWDDARRRMHRAGEAGLDSARSMGHTAAKQARRGMKRGQEWLEDLPIEDVGDDLRDYLEAAKEAIEDTVRGELNDLRKTMRRRRRRMGI